VRQFLVARLVKRMLPRLNAVKHLPSEQEHYWASWLKSSSATELLLSKTNSLNPATIRICCLAVKTTSVEAIHFLA
jgi:hypothetical protein